jgi:hypothetical protein
VNGVASGNFRNVRAFDHLNCSKRDEQLRKATWYFDGRTMGEYRIPALSLAFRRGLSEYFGPSTVYAAPLLSSVQPASVPWSETEGFAHYFTLMNEYTKDICNNAKERRLDALIKFYQEKENESGKLSQAGFNLGERSFAEAATSCVGALEAFKADRSKDLKALH